MSNAPYPASHPIGKPLLWLMRSLALAGLAVAVFLTYAQLSESWRRAASAVPLCGGAAGFDCGAVLFGPHGKWLGLPVAPFAAAVYVALIACLCCPARRAARLVMLWAAIVLIGAAAYYVHLQANVLELWCTWCLAEHAIGVMLGVLLLATTPWRALGWRAGVMACVGVAALGLMAAGHQLAVNRFDGLQHVVISDVAEADRWIEPIEEGRPPWSILGGKVELNPALHPMLGPADADRYIVEVIDFTCARCRGAHAMLSDAARRLGDRVGVIVVFCPLNPDCNPHVERASDAAMHACTIARLAAAVWLIDPAAYPRYHTWLFERDPAPQPGDARAYAQKLVGPRALADALNSGQPDRLVARDVELASKLELRTMPGVIVGDTAFSALPVEANTMVDLLRTIWPELRR